MKLFQWPGRTSKKAFVERFQAALQQHLPEATVEPAGELELRVVRAPDGYTQTVWLARAYQEFCKTPAKAEEIISRWLRTVATVRTDAIDPDRIIPMIKGHGWLKDDREQGFDPWTEPYNSELIIVFAQYSEGLHFCERKRCEDLRIPITQLRDRAFANLRRLITEVKVTGEEGGYLLGAGGTIDSSLLLLDDVTSDSRIELAGKPLVAVSDRDSFWIADDANPYAIFHVAERVARCYRSEPYPISRHLFRKEGAHWMPLDPQLEDAAHPIPKLNVIDVMGTKRGGGTDLIVIVASPLQADARSVFRLFTKLDGYLLEIGSDQWRREQGAPTPESTSIIVKLHPDSDPVVPQLLDSYGDWTRSRGAQLRVEALARRE